MGALKLFSSLKSDPRSLTTPAARPGNVTGLWWQDRGSNLAPIVIDDIFGDMVDLVDRNNAIKVPAVARARALLVGTISDLPLYAWRDEVKVRTQPTFLYRCDEMSLWHRIALTIDDLLFHDESLWARVNGEDGRPVSAYRIPFENWAVDADGRILVDGDPVSADQVIYFPGPGVGLLQAGKDTIRGARQIDRAWVARTRSPIPPTLFRQVEKDNVDDEDVSTLIQSWAAARSNSETAGVGFMPYGLDAIFPDIADDAQMFIEGRNAVRLDIANLTNIPASLLDGTTATASLTYVTAEGQRSSFYEQTLRYWTAPLEHRLSMDDIVPRGQRVRFDITYMNQIAPTGEPGRD